MIAKPKLWPGSMVKIKTKRLNMGRTISVVNIIFSCTPLNCPLTIPYYPKKQVSWGPHMKACLYLLLFTQLLFSYNCGLRLRQAAVLIVTVKFTKNHGFCARAHFGARLRNAKKLYGMVLLLRTVKSQAERSREAKPIARLCRTWGWLAQDSWR